MSGQKKRSSSQTTDDGNAARGPITFPIVAIGGADGGLDALIRMFEEVPAEVPTEVRAEAPAAAPARTGMAFVVMLDLPSADAAETMRALAGATTLPVLQVISPTKIEADCIYLVLPAYPLTVRDDWLEPGLEPVLDGGAGLGLASALFTWRSTDRPEDRSVINRFFGAFANAHGRRVTAVLLSGSGSDGAGGIQRITARGGHAIVQSPIDARYDAMPRNAIATGVIDFVLPVAGMLDTLMVLASDQQPEAADQVASAAQFSGRVRLDIIDVLRRRTGHDFSRYKRLAMLEQIKGRLQANGFEDERAYLDFLNANPEEIDLLMQHMSVASTRFFRDRTAFDALERSVLGHLAADDTSRMQTRVWIAGCATGEEAYSLAILLAERATASNRLEGLQIFASDIEERTIALARAGRYPASIKADISAARLRQFFSIEPAGYRIKKSLRDRVLFAQHDVLRDPPFSRVDLICCRNLLADLEADAQAAVLQTFHFALKPGGFLFLGNDESTEAASRLFSVIDKKNRIYRANLAVRTNGRPPLTAWRGNNETASSAPKTSRPNREAIVASEVHQRLLNEHSAPSILVDLDYDIIHTSQGADRFLRQLSGVPTANLLALIHPDLRMELRTALYQALKSNSSVDARRRGFALNEWVVNVNITAKPVSLGERKYILVLFDAVGSTVDTDLEAGTGNGVVIAQLEEEIRKLKGQLQQSTQVVDSTGQELKVANEKSLAIEEALRSANDEIEARKEELRSTNAELDTVNGELKIRIEESEKLNEHLQNMITSCDLATILVDRDIRIRQFTPGALRLFHLIDIDIGRSLLDIRHRLDWASFSVDLKRMFASKQVVERELMDDGGCCHIVRISPYRTHDDRIDGAVLTFIEVTSLRSQASLASGVGESLRSRTGASLHEFQQFDVVGSVRSLVVAAQEGAAAMKIKMSVLSDQPYIDIYADVGRFAQTVRDLLDNALAFTPAEGEIVVRLTCESPRERPDKADGGDEGSALSSPVLFDIFTSPAARSRDEATGTGFGLRRVASVVIASTAGQAARAKR